mmetsp:Transcript_35577/g.54384  ORF Transcript_35577/g.54384 Transcript_35577/m.54384 type:complete len:85 (+) Transcript_35577:2027-2281(+)
MDRLRKISKTAQAEHAMDLRDVFSRFSGKGNEKISQDELLIAMSRVSDHISLGDVKELHRIIVGAQPGSNAGIEEVKVPINEVV